MMAVGIPMMALLGGAALVWSISRILLAADESISPIIGILFALNILTAAALAATFPRRKGIVMALVLAVAVPVVAAGIVGAAVGERPIESVVAEEEAGGREEGGGQQEGGGQEEPAAGDEEEEAAAAEESPEGEESPAAGGGQVDISAEGIQFDTDAFELPAEEEVTIVFENRDEGIPHNVAIYTDDTATEDVFVGEIFPGTETMEYVFTSPSAGTFFFRCDVHPTQMTGTVTIG
jgi:plastocyanin